MIDATLHSSRLHPIHKKHEVNGNPIKPDLGVGQPVVTLAFNDQKKGAESQVIADEIKEVSTLGFAAVLNPNHRSAFELQAKARFSRNFLLTAEALLRHHRLQLGRLTEQEVGHRCAFRLCFDGSVDVCVQCDSPGR